jgi:hypothetical protein
MKVYETNLKNWNLTGVKIPPLYSTWKAYETSLPVRQEGRGFAVLYKRDYWAVLSEVRTMATDLERETSVSTSTAMDRGKIKYLCAPSKSGKSTGVLPAFLESNERNSESSFTHYLYLACFNNNMRNFTAARKSHADPVVAMKQGAQFMVGCVKKLLLEPDGGWPYQGDLNDDPPSVERSREQLVELLEGFFSPRTKILLHIDEHYEMCHRKTHPNTGSSFSTGAMLLFNTTAITVIATYVKPLEITGEGYSSGICRYPVTLPRPDIRKIVADAAKHPRLYFPNPPTLTQSSKNTDDQRLYATLMVRLAMKLTRHGIGHLHNHDDGVYHGEDFENFVQAFENAATKTDKGNLALTNNRLKECIKACHIGSMNVASEKQTHATELLLGIKDKRLNDLTTKCVDLVVIPGPDKEVRISASIERLLECVDTNSKYCVYEIGASRMENVLTKGKYSGDDILISSPLEEAYTWALACRGAFLQNFTFGTWKFKVSRTLEILPKRIFPASAISGFNPRKFFDSLNEGVMYFPNEPGRPDQTNQEIPAETHPSVDIFFCTSRRAHVVVIDVYGGSNAISLTAKLDKLSTTVNFLQSEHDKIAGQSGGGSAKKGKSSKYVSDDVLSQTQYRGVVLAPAAEDKCSRKKDSVIVVSGLEARFLLGGLQQVYKWVEF